MKATLKDIAQRADVSPMTVSRVLRGHGRVNEETRRNVLSIARELGYGISKGEQVLGGEVTGAHNLRIVFCSYRSKPAKESFDHEPSLRDDLIQTLSANLEQGGGKLTVIHFTCLDDILHAIERYKPHGILLSTPVPSSWLDTLTSRTAVFYSTSYDHQCSVDSIYTNENRASASVYSHLLSLGHTNIAWFGIVDKYSDDSMLFPSSDNLVDQLCSSVHNIRYSTWANLAYCQLDKHKQPLLILERDWNTESLEDVVGKGVSEILNIRPQPTAIVTPADSISHEVIKNLAERGIRVPEDISVVSYGGNERKLPDGRELTTVILPVHPIAKAIPELVRRRLADARAIPISMQLEAQLHIGATTAQVR